MKRGMKIIILCLVLFSATVQSIMAEDGVISIGFNLPLTGAREVIGVGAKNAAELVRKKLEAAGGVQIGGKTYRVEFLYGDNKSEPSAAGSLALQQISQQKALAIIGGLSSPQAIQIGQMCQAFATPMISPNSTSPVTTLNRPYVFRSCQVLTVQGPAATKFAIKEYNATKAAVLYNILNGYSRGLAKNFKKAFEDQNGTGSVVSFEDFRTGDEDYSKQLARIKESGAEVIFLPQKDSEVPYIVRQAKSMGMTIPFMGSNSWGGGTLIRDCGADCIGLYFVGSYTPIKATGMNKVFVDQYQAAYNRMPDEPAAHTWDAIRVMIAAIEKVENLTGNLLQDRTLVKNALTKIRDFEGAAGKLNFNEGGDPTSCSLIMKIEANNSFSVHDSFCP